ncbi:MAG TPA: Gfo/Idh/MocA family oxidoreductase [Gaiellaceae bacterium]|nr:Gfo/Idh/MocA family oxidoreductase [Gaiellaceae bacterium]
MLGYAFMGKAHSRALLALRHLDVPLRPELVSISGRTAAAVEDARARWGWAEATTDWREQVADERIGLFDNGGPNVVHAEPTIAAARAGKHVLCEKPLGMSAAVSYEMWREAERAEVKHMCGFNYRFVPAVRLARELIDGGELGDVVHFRARYLQSWGWEADESIWRFDRAQAGTGAIGDLGTHIVDLARYLVGEITSVSARVRTLVPGRAVDDHFVATIEFENGVVGTLEASRLARGRINSNAFEVNGSKGSLSFDVERLNELEVADTKSFRRVLVTEPDHPFMRHWWPPGHIVGWGDTFTHELAHLLEAIAGEHDVAPHGATFEDGYRCDEVVEAIQRSAASGRGEEVTFR